jgi:hypothetical protein
MMLSVHASQFNLFVHGLFGVCVCSIRHLIDRSPYICNARCLTIKAGHCSLHMQDTTSQTATLPEHVAMRRRPHAAASMRHAILATNKAKKARMAELARRSHDASTPAAADNIQRSSEQSDSFTYVRASDVGSEDAKYVVQLQGGGGEPIKEVFELGAFRNAQDAEAYRADVQVRRVCVSVGSAVVVVRYVARYSHCAPANYCLNPKPNGASY